MPKQAFLSLPTQTQQALSKISSAVSGIEPEEVRAWKFSTSDLLATATPSARLPDVSTWAGARKKCLYHFQCAAPEVDLAAVERAFAAAKGAKDNERAFARYNRASSALYVGSSQAIAKRVREHLGYGAKGTYALQLAHWAQPLALELELVCAMYPAGTPTEVLHALEDTLWSVRMPMFGRQGRT